MSSDNAQHLDTTYALVGEEGPSYTSRLYDWIPLADPKLIPDASVRLYWLLRSFELPDKGQHEHDGSVVQVTQEDLAEMLHRSVDSVQRALRPLYQVGLVEDLERKRISVRVPGARRPQVRTVVRMRLRCLPPPGYTGWIKPFQARREIHARRAARTAMPTVSAGRTDTANLRPQSERGERSSTSVANPSAPPLGSISAGRTDTANLRPNAADLRCIGNNPPRKEHPSSSLSSSAPQQPTPQESGGGGGELPAGGGVPEGASSEAREFVRGLPWERVPTRAQQARLAALVARAWAAGWTSSTLRRYLTAELAGVRSLYAVWTSRLEQLPEAPPAAPAGSRPGAPAGPVTVIAECPRCERGFRVALGADGQPVATHCRDCREAMTSPDLAPVSA